MEQPTYILFKNAETTTNKIRIPKQFIKQHGSNFYMEIYKDKIVLKPIKEDK